MDNEANQILTHRRCAAFLHHSINEFRGPAAVLAAIFNGNAALVLQAVRSAKVTSDVLPFDVVAIDVKELPCFTKDEGTDERNMRKFTNLPCLSAHRLSPHVVGDSASAMAKVWKSY